MHDSTFCRPKVLLFHHLALETSPTYLFQPLIWCPRGEDALIPLSAYLSGVTKNGVSAAVFQEVYPVEHTTRVQITFNDASKESAKQVLGGKEK